jgi:hypothetical protein
MRRRGVRRVRTTSRVRKTFQFCLNIKFGELDGVMMMIMLNWMENILKFTGEEKKKFTNDDDEFGIFLFGLLTLSIFTFFIKFPDD